MPFLSLYLVSFTTAFLDPDPGTNKMRTQCGFVSVTLILVHSNIDTIHLRIFLIPTHSFCLQGEILYLYFSTGTYSVAPMKATKSRHIFIYKTTYNSKSNVKYRRRLWEKRQCSFHWQFATSPKIQVNLLTWYRLYKWNFYCRNSCNITLKIKKTQPISSYKVEVTSTILPAFLCVGVLYRQFEGIEIQRCKSTGYLSCIWWRN
jgi:hypothetical protein